MREETYGQQDFSTERSQKQNRPPLKLSEARSGREREERLVREEGLQGGARRRKGDILDADGEGRRMRGKKGERRRYRGGSTKRLGASDQTP